MHKCIFQRMVYKMELKEQLEMEFEKNQILPKDWVAWVKVYYKDNIADAMDALGEIQNEKKNKTKD